MARCDVQFYCCAGYGTTDTGEETEKTLADISLSLILLLTNHCTGQSNITIILCLTMSYCRYERI